MNTRFCPTTNGYLHIGHAYMALVNECEAKKSGGQMHVLLDDIQPWWRNQLGDKIGEYSRAAVEDLQWLGIKIGDVVSQHDRYDEIADDLEYLGFLENPLTGNPTLDYDAAAFAIVGEPGRHFYPYVPFLTVCKVVWDRRLGVTHVIRGDDLITEMSLYAHYCTRLGCPIPRQTFLPRLRLEQGELTDVSKTTGNWKLHGLRDQGWTAASVRRCLADSCLIDRTGEWTANNIKPCPILETK